LVTRANAAEKLTSLGSGFRRNDARDAIFVNTLDNLRRSVYGPGWPSLDTKGGSSILASGSGRTDFGQIVTIGEAAILTPGALEGIRVVEWGNFVSGPFCGKVLAELGAQVIKVEPPLVGDESRRHGPFPNHIPDPERSGLFLFANINKRGLTLDPAKASGRQILELLLDSADIFIENQTENQTANQTPDLTHRLALDYESLKTRHPGLIVTSITPYGLSGPYAGHRGYDLTGKCPGGNELRHRLPTPRASDHAHVPGQLPGRGGGGIRQRGCSA